MLQKLPFLLFFFCCCSFGQQEHAWIYFKDKPSAETALQNPRSILSERALQRKQRFQIPVDFRDVPVEEAYISAVKAENTITVMAKSKWLNCVHVIGKQDAIEELANLQFVQQVEFARDELNERAAFALKQPFSKFGTTEIFDYGYSSDQVEMLETDYLHEQDLTGQNLVIAVLDAGFPNVKQLAAFERMRDKGHLLGGYDFTHRSENFDKPELSNHGTLVLSTMAGYVPGYLIGTAPDADYYLFCTEVAESETPVEESYWVEAAERADSLGVDLINSSLSYSLFDDPGYNYRFEDMNGQTSFVSRGANIATEKGILVVVSAGNSAESTVFPGIGAPADAQVLTVGALDENREYVSFSSIGPTSDGRIKPDVMAQGFRCTAANERNEIVQVSGTSFSSPILAGSVASFWQAFPEMTNLEIMDLVKRASSNAQNPDNLIGYGIPNFRMALENTEMNSYFSEEFYVFPNPVSEELYFASPEQHYDVSIYDLTGKLLLYQQNVNKKIDLSGFSRGIYIAKFERQNFRKSLLISKK